MLNTFKPVYLIGTLFLVLFLLTGCIFGGGEQSVNQTESEDPPEEVGTVEGEKEQDKSGELNDEGSEEEGGSDGDNEQELVERELYLLDKNGYVVPQTLELPKTKSVAKQALEYLIKNGPVTEKLPNGIQAVLPQDTLVLGVNIKDNTIIADFSKDFTNYQAEEELKILQAITWTLTQFDGVEKVQIRINGHEQPFMPVDGTPINDGFSRANGINLDSGDVIDMSASSAVTLYFLNQNSENTYYVPVTRRVDTKGAKDNFATIVNELIKGPSMTSDLLSEFHPKIKLLNEPKYEDGTVTLNFNEAVLGNLEGTAISNQLVEPLVLSLTEQAGVNGVAIQVNGEEKVFNEEGESLAKPVTRPEKINTGSF